MCIPATSMCIECLESDSKTGDEERVDESCQGLRLENGKDGTCVLRGGSRKKSNALACGGAGHAGSGLVCHVLCEAGD